MTHINAVFAASFLFFCATACYSTDLTWDQLRSGYHFHVRGLHDSVISFKVNGNSDEASTNFELTKVYNSGSFAKRDEWQLRLINPEGNSIQFLDIDIEIVFSGDRFFFFNPKETQIDLSLDSACRSISNIIFKEINNSLVSSIHTLTASSGEITLENLYSKLRKGYLKEFVDSLPDVGFHFDQCIDVFNLMRYMKNDKRFGFTDKSYELPTPIRSYLDNISNVLNEYAEKYTLRDTVISVVGYADARGFGDEEPLANKLEVRYHPSSCSNEEIIAIPKFVDLGSEGHSTKIDELSDNCQLSAARAKIVLDYLAEKIHPMDVSYRYAAGGIKDKRKKDIPENRSISISIKMEAGK